MRLITRLREARIKSGLTQAQVAAKLNRSANWLSRVEQCQLKLDLVMFCRLSDILGLRPEKLIRQLAEELRRE